MHLPSAATILALSSLGASYVVLPFMHANGNLMQRGTPYKVVNVDGDNDQDKNSSTSSTSSPSADVQTTIQTVTASTPPPVTVTVTSTPSSTPLVSVSPLSPCLSSASSTLVTSSSSSSSPVSSSKVFSWNSIGTLSVLPTGTGFPTLRPSLL